MFYERLKDEVRHGKTVRAAVQPAFKRSWRTIVAADVVTVIAAAVLYVVSIGSVRGFALTLGLSTLLDLFVVWFFKRPTVFLMARNRVPGEPAGHRARGRAWRVDQTPSTPVRAASRGRADERPHAVATFRGHRVPNFEIVGHRNWWFALSGFLIVLSLIGLFGRG